MMMVKSYYFLSVTIEMDDFEMMADEEVTQGHALL